MKVKSWVPIFWGVTGWVVVAEGGRSSPVSSVWSGEVSIGAFGPVFGQPDSGAGLASAAVEA